MAQLREDWHTINASNPGSIRVFHSGPDGNCFFYTLSQHMTGSEQHQLLLRLHIVIELLLNIEFYMNFDNGIISTFAGYVNVTSTGCYRLQMAKFPAVGTRTTILQSVTATRHLPAAAANAPPASTVTASQCSSSAARRSTIQSLNAAKVGPNTLAWALFIYFIYCYICPAKKPV
jgi:hypothetical protein